jgi:hypothetical protein
LSTGTTYLSPTQGDRSKTGDATPQAVAQLEGVAAVTLLGWAVGLEPHLAGYDAFRRLAWVLPAAWILLPLLYAPGVPSLGRRLHAGAAPAAPRPRVARGA